MYGGERLASPSRARSGRGGGQSWGGAVPTALKTQLRSCSNENEERARTAEVSARLRSGGAAADPRPPWTAAPSGASRTRRFSKQGEPFAAQRGEWPAEDARSRTSSRSASPSQDPAKREFKTKLEEACRVFQEEIDMCDTEKKVQHVVNFATKFINASSMDVFGVPGRFPSRLREATRALRTSEYAAVGSLHKPQLQRSLRREAQRRFKELQQAVVPNRAVAAAPFTPRAAELGVAERLVVPERAARPPSAARSPSTSGSGQGPAPSAARSPSRSGSAQSPVAEPTPKEAAAELAGPPCVEEAPAPRAAHGFASTAPRGGIGFLGVVETVTAASRDSPLLVPAQPGTPKAEDFPASEAQPQPAPPRKIDKKALVRKMIPSAFRQYQEDGELHRDNVPNALEAVGYTKPDPDDVQKALSHIRTGYSTLGLDEFAEVVSWYEVYLAKAIERAFTVCDTDNSGSISADELAELFKTFGIVPMTHILEEAITEVDEDGSACLNKEQFHTVMQTVTSRMGCSKDEYDTLVGICHRCDKDGNGELDALEVGVLVKWLGYTLEEEESQAIFKESAGSHSTMQLEELMVCISKVREAEIQKLRKLIEQSDEDGNGTLSRNELPSLLRRMGFWPDMTAVWEAAEDAGLPADDLDFDLGELWRLLTVYRMREGFTRKEVKEIEVVFNRIDKDKVGEIATMDVNRAVRWLGYSVDVEEIQSLMVQVDFDESGRLNLVELQKMLRMHKERWVIRFRDAFEKCNSSGGGVLTVAEYRKAMHMVGCVDSSGNVPVPLARELAPAIANITASELQDDMPYIDLRVFINTALLCQEALRRTFLQNGGFDAADIAELREHFDKYDRDGSGDIGDRELAQLLEEIFPEMAHDPTKRPMIRQLLSEIDRNGSGSLDFREFIMFMDRFREMRQAERHEKECQAVAKAAFNAKEVEEFRELFVAARVGQEDVSQETSVGVSGADMLSVRGVLQLFRGFSTSGGKANSWNLLRHVREGLPEGRFQAGGEGRVDFPEFLLLMRHLIDKKVISDLQTGSKA